MGGIVIATRSPQFRCARCRGDGEDPPPQPSPTRWEGVSNAQADKKSLAVCVTKQLASVSTKRSAHEQLFITSRLGTFRLFNDRTHSVNDKRLRRAVIPIINAYSLLPHPLLEQSNQQ